MFLQAMKVVLPFIMGSEVISIQNGVTRVGTGSNDMQDGDRCCRHRYDVTRIEP